MKSRIVLIAVAGLAVGLADIARAGSPDAAPPGPLAGKIIRAFQELKPTDDQKRQVADILGEGRAERIAAAGALAEAWKGLRAQVQSDTFDETAVRKACREVAAAGEEAAVIRARTVSRIRAVLTPDQKEILARLQADAGEDIAGRIGTARDLAANWIDTHKTR